MGDRKDYMREINGTIKELVDVLNDDLLYEGCGEYRTSETTLTKASDLLRDYLNNLTKFDFGKEEDRIRAAKQYLDLDKPLAKEELINYVDKPLWVISDNYLNSMRWRVLEKIHVYKNARFILNFTDTTGGIDYDDLKLYRVETNDKV